MYSDSFILTKGYDLRFQAISDQFEHDVKSMRSADYRCGFVVGFVMVFLEDTRRLKRWCPIAELESTPRVFFSHSPQRAEWLSGFLYDH